MVTNDTIEDDMSGNTYRSLFRWNFFYHFISWTSGNITLAQMIYRTIVMPLMVVSVVACLGGIGLGGFVLYSWVDGYNPKYMALPSWVLWLRHTIGSEHASRNEDPRSTPGLKYQSIVSQQANASTVHAPAISLQTPTLPQHERTDLNGNLESSFVTHFPTAEAAAPAASRQSDNVKGRAGDSPIADTCNDDADPRESCITRRLAVADALLNSTYRDALRELATVDQLRLRHDERRWIHERDEKCAWIVEPNRVACVLRLTTERVMQLSSRNRSGKQILDRDSQAE